MPSMCARHKLCICVFAFIGCANCKSYLSIAKAELRSVDDSNFRSANFGWSLLRPVFRRPECVIRGAERHARTCCTNTRQSVTHTNQFPASSTNEIYVQYHDKHTHTRSQHAPLLSALNRNLNLNYPSK